MRRLLGTLIAAALAASGLSVLGIASGHGLNAVTGGGCAAADGLHHATLVVEHGDQWASPNAALSRCIAFASTSITGEDLLGRSGVQYSVQNYSGNGDAVCQVDNEPPAYSSCFQDGRFWALFQSRSGSHGSWSYSSQGIGSLSLNDGDAVGLRYQPQSSALPPPSPLGTCPPPPPSMATPPPVATPPPAATPPPRSATPGHAPAATNPPTSGAVITASPPAPPALNIPSTPGPASAGAVPAAGHAYVVTTIPPPAPPPRPGAPLAPLLAGGTGAGLLALLVRRAVKVRRS